MKYWLVKSEPDKYGWHHFTEQGRAIWDGVRNYQARNNLQAMREGDQVLFYHSVTRPAVVGLAKVTREAYPDPTARPEPADKPTPWYVVELEPTLAFAQSVSLAQIKAEPMLANVALIKQSRLSVMPIKPDEFDLIVKMGIKIHSMPVLQPILNLVDLLHQKGLRDVVVSPGSRSAPLTIAVARHPGLRVRVVTDERAAGFTALGMAQQTQTPVALICTSGSAVYNLSPAVAEAYFQQVPLLLLTADRPHEWLHQQDGQTIDQAGIFGSHVKRSYDLPADYSHADSRWFIERTINEAFDLSRFGPAGPVHVNVPLREPFYPKGDEVYRPERGRVIEHLPITPQLAPDIWHRLLADWERAERKLILVGQTTYQPELQQVLAQISRELNVPVVGEIISNLGRNDLFISQSDTILGQPDEEELENLRPDLLITMGNSFLARNLKTYFRRYPAAQHWHIQPHGDRLIDSFQSLTTRIPVEPTYFFQKLFADLDYQHFREGVEEDDEDAEYQTAWQAAEQAARRVVAQSIRESPFTDWVATQAVLDALPVDSHLHLGNSMPVRYANLCGLEASQAVRVWANRGTSGIDGILSTAVGAALQTTAIVTVLIGDISFFYDRNALWQSELPVNLRIVLLNNAAGHIFRIIDGPAQQPELETFFETPHRLTAERTCADFGLAYELVADSGTLAAALGTFYHASDKPKLLEITTDKHLNAEAFTAYKNRL